MKAQPGIISGWAVSMEGHDREAHWLAFEARHITPFATGSTPRPLRDLALDYGFRTEASLAAAMQVVRKRFRTLLEEVVGEQDGVDPADEVGRVLDVLTR